MERSLTMTSAKMESTVEVLEAMFEKADADLNLLSHKLDTEFSNSNETAGGSHGKPNPSQLLKKISEVKKEYAAIVKEAEAIKEAQQDAMNFFRGELMTLCETLGKLQHDVNMEGVEKPEELTKVENALGIESSVPDQPELGACGGTTISPSEDGSGRSVNDGPHVSDASKSASQSSGSPTNPVLSPYEIRAKNVEFMDLTQEEFLTVSSLTRGRVKLADVNQTYRILWYHFKEGNKEPLSPSDMFKMGLRVTGQTGEAKLKVLRALKLVEISRKGEVTLC